MAKVYLISNMDEFEKLIDEANILATRLKAKLVDIKHFEFELKPKEKDMPEDIIIVNQVSENS